MALILASASPRRRDLFVRLGIPHVVSAAGIDENLPYRTPRELALKVAYAKAEAVAAGAASGDTVVAADTIVVLDGEVFGKPTDFAHARAMLARLSGRTHSVITAVAVADVGGGGRSSVNLDAAEARVTIAALTPEAIAAYVDTGEPMDKAGAYGAQGAGGAFIQRIDGDFFTVVGLPVTLMLRMLEHAVDTGLYLDRFIRLDYPIPPGMAIHPV